MRYGIALLGLDNNEEGDIIARVFDAETIPRAGDRLVLKIARVVEYVVVKVEFRAISRHDEEPLADMPIAECTIVDTIVFVQPVRASSGPVTQPI